MSDEIAAIGIKLETDGIEKGIKSLDTLAGQGAKVEAALGQVEQASVKTGKSLANLGGGSTTQAVTEAERAISQLSTTMAKASSGSGKMASEYSGLTASVKSAVESFTAAEQKMVDGLKNEFAALGMTRSEIEKYSASQAGMSVFAQKQVAAIGQKIDAWHREEAAAKAASSAQDKMAARQEAFISSLKSQVDTLGMSRKQLMEYQAAQMGIGDKASPLIQKLYGTEEALNKTGMSAKQMANNLRGVPAQFTDIVTSLQGGQRPMTVLLQQGGQLKDMFGGIGPAAKALGGYVAGLVNPFTVAAAGIGAFGFAMAKANDSLTESNGIAVQLAATGRGADLTRDQFAALTKELTLLPGVSKATSSAILDEFVKTREIGGEIFRDLGLSVADFAAATGVTAPEAAKTLAKAFADPAKGAQELEAALGSMTSAQILTIEAMTKVGDKAGAQSVLMDALKQSTNGLADQAMTPLGRAVDSLGNSWDTMTGKVSKSSALNTANNIFASMIGNVATLGLRLSELKLPPWLEKSFSGGLNGLVFDAMGGKGQQKGVTASWDAPVDKTDDQVKVVLDLTNGYKSEASAMADVRRQGDLVRESLKALRAEGKGNSIQAKELEDRLAGVNEKLTSMGKKAGGAAASAVKKEQSAYDSLIASIKSKIAQNEEEIANGGKLNDAAKMRIDLAAKLEQGTRTMTAAHQANTKALLAGFDASEQALALSKAQIKFESERDKEAQATNASIAAINAKAQALEDEAAAYGKTASELQALTIARLEDKKAILNSLSKSGGSEDLVKIDEYIEGLKRAGNAADALASKKIGSIGDDALDNARERLKTFDAEGKFLALSTLERKKQVEIDKVRVHHAKEIAKIEASSASDEAKRGEIVKVRQAEQIASAAAVNEAIAQEWSRTVTQYDDLFRTGFQQMILQGEDGIKAFGKTLKAQVYTSIADAIYQALARKFVVNIVGNVLGMGGAGGVAGALGGGGSLMGMANNASSFNTLYGAGSQLMTGSMAGASGASLAYANGIGMIGGDAIGALATANGMWAGVATGAQASAQAAIAANLALEAGTATALAQGTTAAALGAGGTASTGIMAAMGPAGWAALAGLAVVAVLSSQKGDKRFGSSYQYDAVNDSRINGQAFTDGGQRYGVGGQFSSFDAAGGRIVGGPNSGIDFDRASGIQALTIDSINAMLKRMGSSDAVAGFGSGFESSEKGKGFSYAGGRLSSGAAFGTAQNGGHLNNRGSMTNEEAMASYLTELKQATLQALQSATDVPKSIADKLKDVDVNALTGQTLDELVAAIDKVMTEVEAFQIAIKGMPFGQLKDLSFDAASGLIAAAGGLEQLSAGLTGYVENFMNDGARRALKFKQIADTLNAAGANLSIDQVTGATRKDFAGFMGQIDPTTDAGTELLAAMLSVQEGFAALTPELISVAGVTSGLPQIIIDGLLSGDAEGAGQQFADQLMFGVQNALYSGFADQITSIISDQLVSPMVTALATGASISEAISGAAIESMVAQANAAAQALNAILSDVTFQDAMAQISAAVGSAVSGSISTANRGYTPRQAPSRSVSSGGFAGGGGGSGGGGSDRALSAWESATDAIVSAMKDLRQTLIGEGPQGFANLQAQFAIEAAKASSGDIEAYKGLPALAKSLENSNKDFAASSLEQALATARIIETLGNVVEKRTGAKVPGFASGGMHDGGLRVVGERGWEVEATGPARIWNQQQLGDAMRGGSNSEVVAELRALRTEVFELRKSAAEAAYAATKTSRTLDDAASGSRPLAMMEVTE